MSAAEPLARGMISPRRMLEILTECNFADVAEDFVVIDVVGPSGGRSSEEALFLREHMYECEKCDAAVIRESDLRHGLCEPCFETEAINNQQNAMSRNR